MLKKGGDVPSPSVSLCINVTVHKHKLMKVGTIILIWSMENSEPYRKAMLAFNGDISHC